MNKKFLSAILFGALMVASTGTFVSCKDYDDDIKDLQSQIDKKASVEELQSQIAALQTALAEAKAAAEEAKAAAEEAVDTAEAAAAEAKIAAIEAAEAKVAELKKEVDASIAASEAKIKEIAAKVDELSAKVMSIIGHRLTSLSVIPTAHVNGIAAITLTTLKYDPQVYAARAGETHLGGPTDANHPTRPVLDHKDNGKSAVYLATEKNEAYFHVSPSVGVRTQDIEMPSFDCITSVNQTRAANVTSNSPVKPTGWNIDKNVLTVYFKKTVTGGLNPAEYAHEAESGKETFYMASLKAPITEENWTTTEKEIGDPVCVNSEYVRLEEDIKVPYLVNTRTNFASLTGDFADEVQTDAQGDFYVHYHDSLCVYHSLYGELVDEYAQYNKVLDLKKLVTVCVTDEEAENGHAEHKDWTSLYKNYGLAFRFYLANAPYITQGGPDHNSNRTDQQKFAKIDSPENGLMTSKVYTINGNSETAVGREPIVRVELRDTVNNNLVAQRYIKVKWAKTIGIKEFETTLADTLYVCGNYVGVVGTQQMNVDIYDKMQAGGMSKREFHAIYLDAGFDGTSGAGQGEVVLRPNDQDDVESYNLVWTLTHKDIVTKYPNWNAQDRMEFSKVCTWKDLEGTNETLVITLKRTIYKPKFHLWGYDGRYWKNDGKYETFNVNPVVYGAKDWNPGWGETVDHKNAPTCNIYTDLLNGFVDDMGKKPTTGADGILWFEDNGNTAWAGKKLYYADDYPNVATGYQGVARTATANYVAYSKEGVRFVFDKAKLEAANTIYKYKYFNGTDTVPMTATVDADGTQLKINGELAATIHNYRANLCTETGNPTVGDMTYHIVLQEENWDHAPYSGDTPTEAAKALVGELVPIKLLADLCYDDDTNGVMEAAHTELIKEYEAFIINPLTIEHGKTDDFTDATVNGSTIDVKGAFTYTCWNADENGKKYTAYKNGTELQQALFKFYECLEGEWMTGNDQIKTNLAMDANGNLVPTAGVKNGPLPSTTTVTYNSADETLTYYNHSGTPVNREYIMYIPVKFGYKWKSFTETFEVKVAVNAGTPAEQN